MAAVIVQSRFAGLKIEDEEFQVAQNGQKSKKNKTCTTKKTEPNKKISSSNNVNKPQPSNPNKKKKQKAPAANGKQWETWKQKDEELVDGNYESELQQAILLSKLDYEEKKDVYKQLKKEAEVEKKLLEQTAKTNKKQKKKNVMSLDQFNGMLAGENNKVSNEEEQEEDEVPEKDEAFFERVKDETRDQLIKDRINDRVRLRKQVSDEVITRSQFTHALEEKDKEIESLKKQVLDLKEELLTVKTRNRKFCNILAQAEMKDKAQILVETERLREHQAELTAEVASLHSELEKERSKNAELRPKDKKKKSIRFDVSSEAITNKETGS